MKLSLDYPVKPYALNQQFGDSLACVEDKPGPLKDKKIISKKIIGNTVLACPVGYVDLYPTLGMKGHTGADLYAPHGTPLYHCGPDGIVDELSLEIERGIGIAVVTNDKFDFETNDYQVKLRYWHLKDALVRVGDKVHRGQLIGHCDNTGVSAGDHLHFEVKPVSKDWKGLYINVWQDNGYFGAVDPTRFFNGKYAQDFSLPTDLTLTKNLHFGMRSVEVERLQTKLKKLGYFTYPEITGFYGKVTQEAVYAFQQEQGLVKFGFESMFGFYFGPKSRARLNIMGSP